MRKSISGFHEIIDVLKDQFFELRRQNHMIVSTIEFSAVSYLWLNLLIIKPLTARLIIITMICVFWTYFIWMTTEFGLYLHR